jgi:hypothetical protein
VKNLFNVRSKNHGTNSPLQLPLLATMGTIESSLEPLENYNSINTLIKVTNLATTIILTTGMKRYSSS